MSYRILLVEDEESIRDLIKLNLEIEDYEVVCLDNGKEVVKTYHQEHFDLILLDVMLPEVDGFQVCEQIRLIDIHIPILMLTAKDAQSDKLTGLKKGADDYLTKPFNLEELLLRIEKLIRRANPKEKEKIESVNFGENYVNFVTYEAKGNKGEFTLTKKEAMLLKLLIDRKNEVVSRQQILQSVWGYDVYPSTRTIDNFILSFRKYFEKDPKDPQFFLSVRGVGYKFINQ
jgi:two-component system alkaline phosphatase synthesis response regulator PhoP